MDVRAGFAARDLTPETGVPLGGYGGAERRSMPFSIHRRQPHSRFFKPSTGVLDPIRAKAFVLERDGRRLVFLSLDAVGVTAALHRDIATALAPLGFDADGVFASATHTHSGPGTLSRELVWEALATDVFRPAVYDRFLAGVVQAVRDADAARQPARLHALAFAAEGLQRNRRHRPDFCDPTANVLLAKSTTTGRWLGALVNFAIHGTALPATNLEFSADVPGGIERALERRLAAPVLFVNGAEGDVSPIHRGLDGIEAIGRRFADQAMAALPRARAIGADWSVRTRIVRLARPGIGVRLAGLKRLKLTIGLGAVLPREVTLSVVRLGDMTLIAWPGEPTTTLGFAIKESARAAGAAQVWVLGLTNGYAGYFVTPDEYDAGGYEACAALHGPHAGARLIDELESMLRLE